MGVDAAGQDPEAFRVGDGAALEAVADPGDAAAVDTDVAVVPAAFQRRSAPTDDVLVRSGAFPVPGLL